MEDLGKTLIDTFGAEEIIAFQIQKVEGVFIRKGLPFLIRDATANTVTLLVIHQQNVGQFIPPRVIAVGGTFHHFGLNVLPVQFHGLFLFLNVFDDDFGNSMMVVMACGLVPFLATIREVLDEPCTFAVVLATWFKFFGVV
tara:strand:- start:111 stop:533 length:423 start_codon:yes stop_codon:yes gene_type:complete